MNKYILLFAAMICTTLVYGQKVKKVSGEDFGAGIAAKTYVDYATVMKDLNASDTLQVTMRASVNEVCAAKGCWMSLADNDEMNSDMMVRFQDYGFFVPKDIGGREVLVEGKAYATEVSVDELRHYAADAGKSEEEIEKITESERTYAFMATGVRVVEK